MNTTLLIWSIVTGSGAVIGLGIALNTKGVWQTICTAGALMFLLLTVILVIMLISGFQDQQSIKSWEMEHTDARLEIDRIKAVNTLAQTIKALDDRRVHILLDTIEDVPLAIQSGDILGKFTLSPYLDYRGKRVLYRDVSKGWSVAELLAAGDGEWVYPVRDMKTSLQDHASTVYHWLEERGVLVRMGDHSNATWKWIKAKEPVVREFKRLEALLDE